ncbi:MAG: hypothetical protein ACRDBH_09290 [Bosea sp. (in: a-proteobacteria)]
MTIIYYGVNPHDGDLGKVVVSSGSTTSKAIEVSIDNTKLAHEGEIEQALKRILMAIQQKRFVTT